MEPKKTFVWFLLNCGGGKIKRKLFLSVLLLFGLALVINTGTSAATTVGDTHSPVVKTVDPVKNAVVTSNKIIKVKFNEPIKKGNKWIVLKNSKGSVKPSTSTVKGNTLTIVPKTPLTMGVHYSLVLHSGSVKDRAGNRASKYSTSFSVSSLSLSQIKNGLARAQKFYNKNYRLPNYISYGSNKIPISKFKKILASQGLKIKTVSAKAIESGTKPVYITSDNIINKATDNTRINRIVNGLRAMGLKAYNMGLGPNTHVKVLQSGQVPKNALVIDIYGGACAGTLYEMGSSWYKSIRGTKEVYTIFWPPAKVITGLPFLVRAHDDNFSPASFTGLPHPDQFLLKNGYNYLYSGSISAIVSAIYNQATH